MLSRTIACAASRLDEWPLKAELYVMRSNGRSYSRKTVTGAAAEYLPLPAAGSSSSVEAHTAAYALEPAG